MISYKEYKQLNESFVGVTGGTLGLKTTPSLGLVGSHTKSVEEMLEEAKKKAKKMLAGSGEGPVPGDSGDGEVVPPKAVKDKVKDDDAGDDADVENLDTDDDGDDALAGVKFSKKKCKKEGTEGFDNQWADFVDSLKSQMQPAKSYWDGFSPQYKEEILIPDNDPNAGLVAADASEPVQTVSEPAPGEVGFAPEQSLVTMGGFDIRGYLESVTPVKKK